MWRHGKDGNDHQRQHRYSAKGTVAQFWGMLLRNFSFEQPIIGKNMPNA